MKCVECDFPMRPRRRTLAQYPGTRENRGHGRCATCITKYRARNRDLSLPKVEIPERVFDVELARAALEAYMVERRKRREANGLAA